MYKGGGGKISSTFATNAHGAIVSQSDFNIHSGVDKEPDDADREIGDKAGTKAVKNDDAEVPVHIWNSKLISDYPMPDVIAQKSRATIEWSLDIIRKFMLAIWFRSIFLSFRRFLHLKWKCEYEAFKNGNRMGLTLEFKKDIEAGSECLGYATSCSWWEWLGGSRLFFWRWNLEFQKWARDGLPIYWLRKINPSNKKPQPPIHDPEVKRHMKKKLNKVRNRGYIRNGLVQSLIRVFAVPKGLDDIRMVYDGTASGFNDSVWVPNFGLPTVDTLLRGTSPASWMVDLDIGDMFLNFMLAEEARVLVGVDLTPFFPEEITEEKKTLWEQWVRCAMGLKISPYQTIKTFLHGEEFFLGFPKDDHNPFHYVEAKLNLPGLPGYCPGTSWFSLVRSDGELATILATYVDDERIHAETKLRAWEAAHQLSTRESYLGIQDAARKRRAPSQNAGAWAGSIVRTNNEEVGILVSEERWLKTRRLVRHWLDKVRKSPENLKVKDLLSDRGFLIYICRTYKAFTPYLKGLHLTIDGWRNDRDDDGWKIATAYSNRVANGSLNIFSDTVKYPEYVVAVPRLKDDLEALKELTDGSSAPVVVVSSNRIYIVRYGFGDASGGGFGSSMVDSVRGLEIQIGTWNEKGTDKSSNFRELGNIVIRLEKEAKEGKLKGSEVFMFTDNSTSESAFYHGTSSSKTLFELVVRLRKLELREGVKIHIVHVSGTRMILQGTDGISRGNCMEGIMVNNNMLSFVPIGRTAVERSPLLLEWIRTWTSDPTLTNLMESDWFWRGQGLSNEKWVNSDGMKFPIRSTEKILVWTPAPCIADVALEALRKSIHKRPDLTHLFVCPKLMTYKWRKIMLRSCDCSFYVDAGPEYWNTDMHESLLIGIYLPLLPCPPWTFRRSNSVLALEGILRQVQKSKTGSQGTVLCKFLKFAWKLPSLQDGMVWDLLRKGRIR